MPHFDKDQLPSPADFRHKVELPIRFNDIDILGHLNNTVYFSFYDTGKAYYMESVNGGRMNWRRVETVVANVDCAFIEPIYFGMTLQVCTKCEHIGEKSISVLQMLVDKQTQRVKSICRSIMVSINPDTVESTPLPERWRRNLEAYEAGLTNPDPELLKESL